MTQPSNQSQAQPTNSDNAEDLGGNSVELTERERKIIRLIASGKPNREIADEMLTSKRALDKELVTILSKLEISSRTQLVLWAIKNGLYEPNSNDL